ncbi:unnamed protein product, partial [Laminaria digitata]
TLKVDIQIPLFRDEQTPEFQETSYSSPSGDGQESSPPTIHMDAMAFGMGCCCLQVTFQARDIDESRYMFSTGTPTTPSRVLPSLTKYYKGGVPNSAG